MTTKINLGTGPDSGNGDPLRTALGRVNEAIDVLDALAVDVAELQADPLALPATYVGAWATATLYPFKSVVTVSDVAYISTVVPSHTSGASFATDLAAGKWQIHQGVTAADIADAGGAIIDLIKTATGYVTTKLKTWLGWQDWNAFEFLTSAEITEVQSGTPATNLVAKLQAALNAAEGGTLRFSAGTYGMVPGASPGPCLVVPSNITIIFDPDARLQLLAHNAEIYQMLRVWDRENVTIIRPVTDGSKALNSAGVSEAGMGIDLRGGKNIKIIHPRSYNTWGDGIYITKGIPSGLPPEDVLIDSPYAEGCRRQGISISSARRLTIRNPVAVDINDTNPGGGIDIEPDDNNDVLEGIVITSPRSKDCIRGIQVNLFNFAGAVDKVVDITITDADDDGSTKGIDCSGCRSLGSATSITGKITFERPVSKDAGANAFVVENWDVLGPLIEFIRPVAIDPNRVGHAAAEYGTPFTVFRDSASAHTYAIGNVRFIEPTVILKSGTIPRLLYGHDKTSGVGKVEKVYFLDPLQLYGLTNDQKRGYFSGTGNISDKFNVWNYEYAATGTLDVSVCCPITIPSASTVAITLGNAQFRDGGPDLIFRQTQATATLQVKPHTGGNFIGMAVDAYYQVVNAKGASIRLKPLGSNQFCEQELAGPVTKVPDGNSATTAQLTAIGNSINTVGKYAGKAVLNTTTNVTVIANGATAGAHWFTAAGVDTHTPV